MLSINLHRPDTYDSISPKKECIALNFKHLSIFRIIFTNKCQWFTKYDLEISAILKKTQPLKRFPIENAKKI